MARNRTQEIADVIRNRRKKIFIWSGYKDLLVKIIFLIVISYILFGHVFLITQAKGMEMFPAIKDGDLVIVFQLHKAYEKGDVVSYTINGKRHLGRIVAASNNVVSIEDEGILRVNGTPQTGEIMYPTYPKEFLEYPFQIPDKHFFVLGDYRTQSEDSRDFGTIPLDLVDGKVITILRRQGL